jgi:hypothetical protein
MFSMQVKSIMSNNMSSKNMPHLRENAVQLGDFNLVLQDKQAHCDDDCHPSPGFYEVLGCA